MTHLHPIRVEFRDTDAAGMAHFSVFFVWMEQAEHATLRKLGLTVLDRSGPATVSWPRVAAKCDYKSPVRFEDLMDVTIDVRKLGTRSVTYGFEFECDGREVASGQVTTVCCIQNDAGIWTPTPIPEDIADQLAQLVRPT